VRRVELMRPSIEAIFLDIVEKSGASGDTLEKLRSEVRAARSEAGAEVPSA
jgi:hypothetical protein